MGDAAEKPRAPHLQKVRFQRWGVPPWPARLGQRRASHLGTTTPLQFSVYWRHGAARWHGLRMQLAANGTLQPAAALLAAPAAVTQRFPLGCLFFRHFAPLLPVKCPSFQPTAQYSYHAVSSYPSPCCSDAASLPTSSSSLTPCPGHPARDPPAPRFLLLPQTLSPRSGGQKHLGLLALSPLPRLPH